MGLWWHFVDLTQDQKHHRRILNDWYAALAQLSVCIPIALLQIYFLLCWAGLGRKQNRALDPLSSPHLKAQRTREQTWGLQRVLGNTRRLIWWAGEPLDVLGSRISTKGELLGAVGWTAWLLVLCALQTGNDYLALTKRFGIIASSQLPLQYLLSLKSPYSPLQWATRASWETLNRLHQILGQISILLFYLHGAFYLNYYVQLDILSTKLWTRVVIFGILGLVAFTVLGTSALSWLRRVSYRLFYIVHVTLATLLLPILFLHVAHIRLYIYETAAIYVLHTVLRYLGTGTYSATLTRISSSSDMVKISIDLASTTAGRRGSRPSRFPNLFHGSHASGFAYAPGQHIYLSVPPSSSSSTWTRFMPSSLSANPFTIASTPDDYDIKLLARARDGRTKKLLSDCSTNTPSRLPAELSASRTTSLPQQTTQATTAAAAIGQQLSVKLRIEGPYGLPSHSLNLLAYDRVLFIAGGVGATFIMPLYRTLLNDLSPSPGSRRRQRVKFIWAVKTLDETSWALHHTSSARRKQMANDAGTSASAEEVARRGIRERLRVFVTDVDGQRSKHGRTGDAVGDDRGRGQEMTQAKSWFSNPFSKGDKRSEYREVSTLEDQIALAESEQRIDFSADDDDRNRDDDDHDDGDDEMSIDMDANASDEDDYEHRIDSIPRDEEEGFQLQQFRPSSPRLSSGFSQAVTSAEHEAPLQDAKDTLVTGKGHGDVHGLDAETKLLAQEQQDQHQHQHRQQERPRKLAGARLKVQTGRPDLWRVVQETFSHSLADSVAVVVCGPSEMSAEVRDALGPVVNMMSWINAASHQDLSYITLENDKSAKE